MNTAVLKWIKQAKLNKNSDLVGLKSTSVSIYLLPLMRPETLAPPLRDDLDASAGLRSNCSALAKLFPVYFWIKL